jgi:hypothetical protein
MWSLPDLDRLNNEAARNKQALTVQLRQPKNYPCDGCAIPATAGELYYDIFSDDPKGAIFLCDDHKNSPKEGFFVCEVCERLLIENYTWERYEKDGMCLSCAAKLFFDRKDNWIDPKEVKEIIYEQGAPQFEDGRLNVFAAPHVLGVRQPVPKGIQFIANAEFDGFDGHQISGFDFETKLRSLDRPFALVLDAGWQFAVSIGIYQRLLTDGERMAQTFAAAAAERIRHRDREQDRLRNVGRADGKAPNGTLP